MPTKQIIALGGGNFGSSPRNLALDRYVLAQSNSKRPSVAFVPTASGDNDNYVRRFYDAYWKLDCKPRHFSFFRPQTKDLESFFLDRDVIFIGGGNTRNMLTIWRDWGFDKVLKKAYDKGIILAGVSAGSICWFEEGVTDSMTPTGSKQLFPLACLGILPGSNCPHYDGEKNRRPEYHRLLHAGKIKNGLAADDGVGLHYKDDKLHAIVSTSKNAKAYNLTCTDGFVKEEIVEPTVLEVFSGE